jgi:hypothetical protein
VTVLPPALRSLVLLWEELSSGCLRAIHGQVLLLPSAAMLLGPRPSSVSRRPESGGSRPPSAAANVAPTPMVQGERISAVANFYDDLYMSLA